MPMHMQVDSEIKGSFPTQSSSFLKYKKKNSRSCSADALLGFLEPFYNFDLDVGPVNLIVDDVALVFYEFYTLQLWHTYLSFSGTAPSQGDHGGIMPLSPPTTDSSRL